MLNILVVTPELSDIGFNIILGGFGMFLLGIKFLGDGFKVAAGPKIRDYIEKYTGNLFSAILVGTAITALMQSSTAATVISISLVRAGLMSLSQAIGISVGANLGTTVTALMVGLNIEEFGFYFVFLGAVIMLFMKRKEYQTYGQIFFGFGITFVGLKLMGDQLAILQQIPQFEAFLLKMSANPWLALIAGTVATAAINSSSAVIALVQKIYAGGGMSMVAASAFVFGSNVGTTLTAILASVGGSVSTRRSGWFHALYNIIGALATMLIIYPYSKFILAITTRIGASPEMAIGVNHFIFNLVWVVGIIPFIPISIKILEILIPGEDRRIEREKIAKLDYDLIERFPEGAVDLANKQIMQMGDLVLESLHTTQHYLRSKDPEDLDVVDQLEEIVNGLDRSLTSYLIAIARHPETGGPLAEEITGNLEVVKNIERVGDISTNLAKFFTMTYDKRERFSDDALEDLDTMYQLSIDMLERSFTMYENQDTKDAKQLMVDEEYLDLIENKYRERHFKRMADGICNTETAGSVYVDILGNLERVGDHAVNIVELIDRKIV